MKMLLHCCCGPCSIHPINVLSEEGHKITLYFSNPNIHPYKEWKRRKNAFVEYAESKRLPYVIDKSYPLEEYLKESLSYKNRCEHCYATRFDATAKYAKDNGFDGFTSTLFVSPYQNQELMKNIGQTMAEKYDTTFMHYDFRDGFKEAQEKARELLMFMQNYCGCIFSERDRFMKVKK